MPTDTSAPAEVVQAVAAGEAVNALDWADVYKAARRRTLRDMTGTFYEEHLAREIAERLSKIIAHALNAQPLAADALDAEMVEAWAKAMCNAAWASVGEDWSLASDEQQDEFRLMARACLALSSGKTVGADELNTSPERVNETPKSEHDGKTVGAGEGEGDG